MATYTATGFPGNIQSIHDTQAVAGDTIIIPDGVYSPALATSGTPLIQITKAITLRGNNPPNWNAATGTITGGVQITNTYSGVNGSPPIDGSHLINVVPSNPGGHVEIANLYVSLPSSMPTYNSYNFNCFRDRTTSYTIKIHDIIFDGRNVFAYHINCGNGTLIYKCSFIAGAGNQGNGGVQVRDFTSVTNLTSISPPVPWAEGNTMGLNDYDGLRNTYIEDCFFYDGSTANTNFDDHAKAVVRHCTFSNSSTNSHGQESSPWGMVHCEIYNNTFTEDLSGAVNQFGHQTPLNFVVYHQLRGGGFLWANNTAQIMPGHAALELSMYGVQRNSNVGCWGRVLSQGFTMPAINGTVSVTYNQSWATGPVGNTNDPGVGFVVNQLTCVNNSVSGTTPQGFIGQFKITAASSTGCTIQNTGAVGNVAPGTAIPAGASIGYPAPLQCGIKHTGTGPYGWPYQQGATQNGWGRVDGSGYDLDPIYIWGNQTPTGQPLESTWGSGFLNLNEFYFDGMHPSCQVNGTSLVIDHSAATGDPNIVDFLQSGRDYIIGQARPGWVPYTYPHPLRLTGTGGNQPLPPVTVKAGLNNPSQPTAGILVTLGNANQTLSGTPSFVQAKGDHSSLTGQTSFSQTFASSNTAGNCIIVAATTGTSGPGGTPTVTDGSGNTYTLVRTDTSTGISPGIVQYIWYASNIAANPSNTVTVNAATTFDYPDVNIYEYTGVSSGSPVDVHVGNFGAGTQMVAGTLTTTSANDLIFVHGAAMQATTFVAGSGFALRNTTDTWPNQAEDELATNIGSYTCQFNNVGNGNAWVMAAIALKPLAGTTRPFPYVTPIGQGKLTPSPVLTPVRGLSTTVAGKGQVFAQGIGYRELTATALGKGKVVDSFTYPTPNWVQGNWNNIGLTGQTSVSASFNTAPTAGNCIVVKIAWATTGVSVSSVTDTSGNTYSFVRSDTNAAPIVQAMYVAPNIAAGNPTVTANFSAAANYPDIQIYEYSGVATTSPIDASVGTSGVTDNPSMTVTTTAYNDLLVCGMAATGHSAIVSGATGFTYRGTLGDSFSEYVSDRVAMTPTGSQTVGFTATMAGATWVFQAVALKPNTTASGNLFAKAKGTGSITPPNMVVTRGLLVHPLGNGKIFPSPPMTVTRMLGALPSGRGFIKSDILAVIRSLVATAAGKGTVTPTIGTLRPLGSNILGRGQFFPSPSPNLTAYRRLVAAIQGKATLTPPSVLRRAGLAISALGHATVQATLNAVEKLVASILGKATLTVSLGGGSNPLGLATATGKATLVAILRKVTNVAPAQATVTSIMAVTPTTTSSQPIPTTLSTMLAIPAVSSYHADDVLAVTTVEPEP